MPKRSLEAEKMQIACSYNSTQATNYVAELIGS
jgi:hypothetical protein